LELGYLDRPEERKEMNWRNDSGAATAEYAIATMAAVGLAGLLVVILRSDDVKGILFDLIRSALSLGVS
jgi:Flp pilus assembly pilin Flp